MSNPPRGLNLGKLHRETSAALPSGSAHGHSGKTGEVHESPVVLSSVVAKERRVQAILANIENLPSLPSVVMETLRLANNADASADDFQDVIRKDQVLTARVLKLVNSPFYALRKEVQSIPQAIVVLGLKTLKSVVLAANTSKLLDGELGGYGFREGGLWQHSMACATVARMLSREAKLTGEAEEEMFVAGLLHDVGKLVLAKHTKDVRSEFEAALTERPNELVAIEEDVIGMSHTDAGRRMAKKWGLPDSLADLIGAHHDPLAAVEDERVLIVQMADDFCRRKGVGMEGDGREPEADAAARCERLGVGKTEEELFEKAEKAIAELEPIFAEMQGNG